MIQHAIAVKKCIGFTAKIKGPAEKSVINVKGKSVVSMSIIMRFYCIS